MSFSLNSPFSNVDILGNIQKGQQVARTNELRRAVKQALSTPETETDILEDRLSQAFATTGFPQEAANFALKARDRREQSAISEQKGLQQQQQAQQQQTKTFFSQLSDIVGVGGEEAGNRFLESQKILSAGNPEITQVISDIKSIKPDSKEARQFQLATTRQFLLNKREQLKNTIGLLDIQMRNTFDSREQEQLREQASLAQQEFDSASRRALEPLAPGLFKKGSFENIVDSVRSFSNREEAMSELESDKATLNAEDFKEIQRVIDVVFPETLQEEKSRLKQERRKTKEGEGRGGILERLGFR